jgi:hypothetical protein
MFEDREKYKIAKYRVTYELLEDDVSEKIPIPWYAVRKHWFVAGVTCEGFPRKVWHTILLMFTGKCPYKPKEEVKCPKKPKR